jgi:hypothetical protein
MAELRACRQEHLLAAEQWNYYDEAFLAMGSSSSGIGRGRVGNGSADSSSDDDGGGGSDAANSSSSSDDDDEEEEEEEEVEKEGLLDSSFASKSRGMERSGAAMK